LALIRWHGMVVLGGGIGIHWRVVLGWYWVVLGGIGTHWTHKGATCAFPSQYAHAHSIQVFMVNQTNWCLTCPPPIWRKRVLVVAPVRAI